MSMFALDAFDLGDAEMFSIKHFRRFLRFTGICAIVLFASSRLAHSEQMPLKHYTTADGLSRDGVNRIVRDSRGFLWFATHEGLSRFDGYQFTNFTADQGLPQSAVNDILETRSGDLWFATNDDVVHFNPRGVAQSHVTVAVVSGPAGV